MAFDFKNASKSELKKEYDRIADEIGDTQFFTKKELYYLPEVLQDGEQVLCFSSGYMDGTTWLITLTDKRIIFLDKGMFFGVKQAFINLDKVNAIQGKTGLIFGEISINDGSVVREIRNVWKKTVNPFVNRTLKAIEDLKYKYQRGYNNINVADQLERLAALKEKGILTEAEFQQQKQKILNS